MDPRPHDIPRGIDESPPTDECGDVDLSLIEHSLSLSLAERARRHYHARLFAKGCPRLPARDTDPLLMILKRPSEHLEAIKRKQNKK